jgi:hypothetical protein
VNTPTQHIAFSDLHQIADILDQDVQHLREQLDHIEPSELMPIRRAIGDPKRQKAMLEQHRLWMERLSNNPALRAAIESKASQRAATCPEEQPVILRQTQAKLSNLPPIAPPSGANTLNPFS